MGFGVEEKHRHRNEVFNTTMLLLQLVNRLGAGKIRLNHRGHLTVGSENGPFRRIWIR